MDAAKLEQIAELITAGRTEDAKTAITALQQDAPDDVHTWLLTASLHEAKGDLEAEREALARAMRIDPSHYEVFYMLGILYAYTNVNQAWLCMEQACHTCNNADDLPALQEALQGLATRPGFHVKPFSVLILSYNDRAIMQKNIEALRRECPEGGHEIIVVDNHSDDGVAEWLREQPHIRLIENGDNVGFPVGCNIGYQQISPDHDLFLLNNDAVCTPNAIFWLRMGLYEDLNVGATGAVSNKASTQKVQEAPKDLEGCITFGAANNVPVRYPYEDRCRLTGFAVMIKHSAHMLIRYDKNIFDPRFSPGYFEDDDLGMRLASAGFRQMVCHNAFIYHKGGSGFAENDSALTESREKFIDKWGFDIWAFEGIWKEMADLIEEEKDVPVRVLELYCGMGIDLSYIRYLYPNAYVAGFDPDASIAGLGRHMADIICGDAEEAEFPWSPGSFDYIIAADAIKNARDPKKLTDKLARYLRPTGAFLYELPADIGWVRQMECLMTDAGFPEQEVIGDLVRARGKTS